MKRTPKQRKRRSGFEVEWIKFPMRWIERLLTARMGSATFKLALVILVENFKLEQKAIKEIVLSKEVTGLSKKARWRAVDNLIRLKLIRVRRRRSKSIRVEDIYI